MSVQAGKLILLPQSRLRTGFFSLLDSRQVRTQDTKIEAPTSTDVKERGKPWPLMSPLPRVDLIVVGSVAVDPVSGARIGKGEGFAALEHAMLRALDVTDATTPVVTTAGRAGGARNDTRILRHDVPVDVIMTSTQTMRTQAGRHLPEASGIYWELLSPEKLGSIRVKQIGVRGPEWGKRKEGRAGCKEGERSCPQSVLLRLPGRSCLAIACIQSPAFLSLGVNTLNHPTRGIRPHDSPAPAGVGAEIAH